MASSYDISTGSGAVNLGEVTGTYVAIQVVADATLNADITVKLKQTSDGTNFEDLANTSTTMLSGGDSVLLESYDFVLDNVYLDIQVGSATAGELSLYTSIKKKEDSGEDELQAAREDYKDIFGKRPGNTWTTEEIRAKITEKE